jgi:hypothetical protein
MKVEAYVERRSFGRVFGITFVDHSGKSTAVAKPLAWEFIPDEMLVPGPTLELLPAQAQALMDDLWACGLRPTEGVGSAGSAAAMQEHLKDMRAVGFAALKKLGIE